MALTTHDITTARTGTGQRIAGPAKTAGSYDTGAPAASLIAATVLDATQDLTTVRASIASGVITVVTSFPATVRVAYDA